MVEPSDIPADSEYAYEHEEADQHQAQADVTNGRVVPGVFLIRGDDGLDRSTDRPPCAADDQEIDYHRGQQGRGQDETGVWLCMLTHDTLEKAVPAAADQPVQGQERKQQSVEQGQSQAVQSPGGTANLPQCN